MLQHQINSSDSESIPNSTKKMPSTVLGIREVSGRYHMHHQNYMNNIYSWLKIIFLSHIAPWILT